MNVINREHGGEIIKARATTTNVSQNKEVPASKEWKDLLKIKQDKHKECSNYSWIFWVGVNR